MLLRASESISEKTLLTPVLLPIIESKRDTAT